ncbi:MAG: hypothetical protein K6B40_05375 [Firmicutes bacterium]|nr:hypothetical protein [Bacillota bacterium]
MFFPWFENPEYRMPPPENFAPLAAEKELQRLYGLTAEQLAWRRWCIDANCGGDIQVFHQEYPAFAGEAFIASGRPVFDVPALVRALHGAEKPLRRGDLEEVDGRVTFVDSPQGNLRLWRLPEEGREYVIGVDTASGKEGGDYAAMEVVIRDSGEQAAEWHGHIDPDLLGVQAAYLGRYYNLARVTPEVNNHGVATVNALKRLAYPRIYRRRTVNRSSDYTMQEYGFFTSARTKPLLISALAGHIRREAEKIHGKETINECLTYMYDEKGAANAREGSHDDRVMALALALYVLTEQPYYEREEFEEGQWYGAVDPITGY